MSKLERVVITGMLTLVAVLAIMMLFKTTDPEPVLTPTYDNTKLELEIENQKLKNLMDSLILVDSIHLMQLKEKQILIKIKKDEAIKAIYFIPNADTKYKDSLWTVYTQDTIGRGYTK
jgi:hypothetical protein